MSGPINQEVIPCRSCGNPSTEASHIIRRSQGGTETMRQCNRCHQDYEMGRVFYAIDTGWLREPDEALNIAPPSVPRGMLHIYDREGVLLAERPWEPRSGGATVTALDDVAQAIWDASANARLDQDDAQPAIYYAIKDVETEAHIHAKLRMMDALGRMPYGTVREKVKAVAVAFSVSERTVYNDMLRAKAEGLLPAPLAALVAAIPIRMLQAAMAEPEESRDEALIHAQHRIQEEELKGDRFTLEQFEAERNQMEVQSERCRARIDPLGGEIVGGTCPLAAIKFQDGYLKGWDEAKVDTTPPARVKSP